MCVPTPLNKTKDPDMRFIASATEEIAAHQHPGMLIVLESTTYPGTTREVLVPSLTKGYTTRQRRLRRVLARARRPGQPAGSTPATRPRSSAASTPACLEVATALYARIIDTLVPVSSTDAAEMVKLLENTFRAVNIGLVNEVAMMSRRLGIDAWEVIRAAATKPFGFMPFFPGPGLGGHCIPIDPLYLSWKLRSLKFQARFIELADAINSAMPEYVVSRVADALNDAQEGRQRREDPHRRRRVQARRLRRARVAGVRRDRRPASDSARTSRTWTRTCPRWTRPGVKLRSVSTSHELRRVTTPS